MIDDKARAYALTAGLDKAIDKLYSSGDYVPGNLMRPCFCLADDFGLDGRKLVEWLASSGGELKLDVSELVSDNDEAHFRGLLLGRRDQSSPFRDFRVSPIETKILRDDGSRHSIEVRRMRMLSAAAVRVWIDDMSLKTALAAEFNGPVVQVTCLDCRASASIDEPVVLDADELIKSAGFRDAVVTVTEVVVTPPRGGVAMIRPVEADDPSVLEAFDCDEGYIAAVDTVFGC